MRAQWHVHSKDLSPSPFVNNSAQLWTASSIPPQTLENAEITTLYDSIHTAHTSPKQGQ